MKRILALLALCMMIFSLSTACTGAFDWTGIQFPCSESRPCANGFTCSGGVCVTQGTVTENTNDGGNVEYDPDSPYRPPVTQPKVAFLYVGPVGDFGWTWAHDQSRVGLDKLGYSTTYAEAVAVQDAPQQIDDFIKKGYNLIVGTSHDFLVPLLSKTSVNEGVNFLTCSGFETGKNMGSYFGRMYQIEWLAGKVAGATTKTNRVGLLVPIAIPEVIRHINAFANGVRSTNPQAEIVITWIGNWFDVQKEPLLTKELIAANVDVIHSHSDTSIPLELIENKGGDSLTTPNGDKVYSIAYNSVNGCSFGPRTCLVSAYWNWTPVLVRILEKMKKGEWSPSEIVWEPVKTDKNDSSVYLSDISSAVPGTARVEIQSWIPKLAKEEAGTEQSPFKAPLKDNTGKTRLAAGKAISDKDMLNMCWFAEGIVNMDGTPAVVPSECKGDR